MNPFFSIPSWITSKIISVDCGARDDLSNPIFEGKSNYVHIGFEPDCNACNKLLANRLNDHLFYPFALGNENGNCLLYITQYPGCSSIYKPNTDLMANYIECEHYYDVVDIKQVTIKKLDDFLPTINVNDVDFLELDTQGSELDILQGSIKFLTNNVLGLKVEVEFIEMYKKQPLFDSVNNYLLDKGFLLFDIRNYYLHRKKMRENIQSKGQLCWGQAYYLRDYSFFLNSSDITKLIKLIHLSSALQFHDYAIEIYYQLSGSNFITLTDQQNESLSKIFDKYLSDLSLNQQKDKHMMDWVKKIYRSIIS